MYLKGRINRNLPVEMLSQSASDLLGYHKQGDAIYFSNRLCIKSDKKTAKSKERDIIFLKEKF